MIKELLHDNCKRLIFAAIIFGVSVVLFAGIYATSHLRLIAGNRAVSDLLESLSYTEENADEEMQKLREASEKYQVSGLMNGMLYKAMTEISYITGDDSEYNRYLGYAMFYLERSGDDVSVIYLYNKYIGRFYANGCYEAAKTLLSEMYEKYSDALLSAELRASYYLSYADVSEALGEDARDNLRMAQDAIILMQDGSNKLLFEAKYDILTARMHIMNGNYEQAESIMAKYNISDSFGISFDNVYVVCDFRIPYYEIMTKLFIAEKNYDSAFEYADKYVQYCSEYDFRAMKLNLLQYVIINASDAPEEQYSKYCDMESRVSEENLDEMKDEYGKFLLAGVDGSIKALTDTENTKDLRNKLFIVVMTFVYSVILLFCFILLFIDYLNKDSLTKLNNRKKYERARIAFEKHKSMYILVMFDIDGFKQINDRFGHQTGDEVLEGISAIIREYTGKNVHAYRYGGEELCLMFTGMTEEKVCEISETIRKRIEAEIGSGDMKVTVSGGVGVSEKGEDAFHNADRFLYYAKGHGKNMICHSGNYIQETTGQLGENNSRG